MLNHIKKLVLEALAVIGLITLAAVLSAVVYGAEKKKKKNEPPPPIVDLPQPRPQPTPARPANGSLYSAAAPAGDLFSDFKPRRPGDLVFVDVVEASSANVSSGASRGRDSGTLGGLATVTGVLPVPGAAVAGTVIGALGNRKFEGKGSTQRESDVKARIVARVVEVLPNGDLRIEARKLVRINKENEWLALSGIIRPRDVSSANAIPTTAVGDLTVELNGKGVASADNAPGWLFRLFEKITPF
jgi:flagellar L-ring protein precursor FlgH